MLERAPATLTRGGRFQLAGVVININGVTDPASRRQPCRRDPEETRQAHHNPDPADGSGLRLDGRDQPRPRCDWNDPAPTWDRIDNAYNVQSWSIDRGRPNEMSAPTPARPPSSSSTAPATSTPPTPAAPTTGSPRLTQAKIELQNQDTDAWSTLFRGFVASIRWTPYRSLEHANVTLELVDGLALLAACEMVPNGDFGDSVESGNIVFDEDLDLDAIGRDPATRPARTHQPGPRSGRLAGRAPLDLHRQRRPWGTPAYAPRSTVLSVIQDCADAEFPDAANVYISGPRGEVGDAPPGVAHVPRPVRPLQPRRRPVRHPHLAARRRPSRSRRRQTPCGSRRPWSRPSTTRCCTRRRSRPNSNIADADIAGQYVTDTAAVAD